MFFQNTNKLPKNVTSEFTLPYGMSDKTIFAVDNAKFGPEWSLTVETGGDQGKLFLKEEVYRILAQFSARKGSRLGLKPVDRGGDDKGWEVFIDGECVHGDGDAAPAAAPAAPQAQQSSGLAPHPPAPASAPQDSNWQVAVARKSLLLAECARHVAVIANEHGIDDGHGIARMINALYVECSRSRIEPQLDAPEPKQEPIAKAVGALNQAGFDVEPISEDQAADELPF